MSVHILRMDAPKWKAWAVKKVAQLRALRVQLGLPAMSKTYRPEGGVTVFVKSTEWGDSVYVAGSANPNRWLGGEMRADIWDETNSLVPWYKSGTSSAGVSPNWSFTIKHWVQTFPNADNTYVRRHHFGVHRYCKRVAYFTYDETGSYDGDTFQYKSCTAVYDSIDSGGTQVTVHDIDAAGASGASYTIPISPTLQAQSDADTHGIINPGDALDPGDPPTTLSPVSYSVWASLTLTGGVDPYITPPPGYGDNYINYFDYHVYVSDAYGGYVYSAHESTSYASIHFADGTLGPPNGLTDHRVIVSGNHPVQPLSGPYGLLNYYIPGTYDDYGQIPPATSGAYSGLPHPFIVAGQAAAAAATTVENEYRDALNLTNWTAWRSSTWSIANQIWEYIRTAMQDKYENPDPIEILPMTGVMFPWNVVRLRTIETPEGPAYIEETVNRPIDCRWESNVTMPHVEWSTEWTARLDVNYEVLGLGPLNSVADKVTWALPRFMEMSIYGIHFEMTEDTTTEPQILAELQDAPKFKIVTADSEGSPVTPYVDSAGSVKAPTAWVSRTAALPAQWGVSTTPGSADWRWGHSEFTDTNGHLAAALAEYPSYNVALWQQWVDKHFDEASGSGDSYDSQAQQYMSYACLAANWTTWQMAWMLHQAYRGSYATWRSEEQSLYYSTLTFTQPLIVV